MTETIADKMTDYGKICWLWANSSLHKDWPATHQTRSIIPAIENGQYYILEKDGFPVAYCSWAWLSLETEMQYVLDCSSVPPENWNSGDRLWFVDWIAPFKRKHTVKLKRKLSKMFAEHTAHSIRVYAGKDTARVASYTGSKVSPKEARSRHDVHHAELVKALSVAQSKNNSSGLTAPKHSNTPAE